MGKISWVKIFMWVFFIGGFFYLLKEVRSKLVWLVVLIIIAAVIFINFMRWIWEQDE